MPRGEDLVGQTFGEWTVISKLGGGFWECQCSCSEHTIRKIRGYDLKTGKTKSCGHDTTKFKDLTGKKFGSLIAIEYIGNQRWRCECDCNNHTIIDVRTYHLTSGQVKSCGCKTAQLFKQTMISRYGDISSSRIGDPRTLEQLAMISSKEALMSAVKAEFREKPSLDELAKFLNMSVANASLILHKFDLPDLVKSYSYSSHYEDEISEYILELKPDIRMSRHNKSILHGSELDIYLPEYKLAIEFNGTYWHSSEQKSATYHQNKTFKCYKAGIRLIHIFEYEWNDIRKKTILKNLLKSIIKPEDNIIIRANKTTVREINSKDSALLLNTYHLQENASANIHIGLYSNYELIGVITFGKPRFNTNHEYELVRLAWKSGIVVTGGAEKLFSYFIRKYNPTSIISYCDIGKFTGGVYDRLGFKFADPPITKPNYSWVNLQNQVQTRYKTMKHLLIAKGYGNLGNTEDEIMKTLGYFKIYDSGNMRLEWNR